MENIFVEFLPPWVETNMQPAFYDKESGTCLQQTARMYDRVNMLVRMFNKLSKETTESFNTLYNFVHDYFDNLDVQEEINNKLDEMAEDGSLQELINAYINSNATLGFDTLNDMKTNEHLVAGSFCHILGRDSINDGGENFYKVREKDVSDVVDDVKIVALNDNTLVAELIKKDEYFDFKPTYVRYVIDANNMVATDVWYCIIPKEYKPELFLANDEVNQVEYGNSNAYRNKTSLQINAGLFDTDTNATIGMIINNGETLKTNTDLSATHNILYMASDGTLDSVAGTTPTSTVEALEPVWAVTGWNPIVKDGVDLSGDLSTTDYKPRSFIGQDSEGNYILGCATGRMFNQQGLTQPQIKDFCDSVGFTPYFLFNLDGGGSSEMLNYGRRVSRVDYYNTRACANYIGFRRKDVSNESLFKTNYNADVIENTFEYERRPLNYNNRIWVHEDSANDVQILGSANTALTVCGQIANVNIRFKNTSTLPTYRKVIDGLPLPYQSSYLSVLAFNVNDGTTKFLNIHPSHVTDSSGMADLVVSGIAGGLPTGSWVVNITYTIKEAENKYNFPTQE